MLSWCLVLKKLKARYIQYSWWLIVDWWWVFGSIDAARNKRGLSCFCACQLLSPFFVFCFLFVFWQLLTSAAACEICFGKSEIWNLKFDIWKSEFCLCSIQRAEKERLQLMADGWWLIFGVWYLFDGSVLCILHCVALSPDLYLIIPSSFYISFLLFSLSFLPSIFPSFHLSLSSPSQPDYHSSMSSWNPQNQESDRKDQTGSSLPLPPPPSMQNQQLSKPSSLGSVNNNDSLSNPLGIPTTNLPSSGLQSFQHQQPPVLPPPSTIGNGKYYIYILYHYRYHWTKNTNN